MIEKHHHSLGRTMYKITNSLIAIAFAVTLTSTSPVLAQESIQQEALQMINDYRKKKRRKPLEFDAKVQKAAQLHAEELVKRGYGTKMTSGGHIGKNGSKPMARLRKRGHKSCSSVENIAYGQKTPAKLMADWAASKLHSDNLLNKKVKVFGLGFAPPKTWVFVASKPCK